MAEQAVEKEKKPVQILRDRHGGISETLKESYKFQVQTHKALKEALKGGPLTIPELARATGVAAEQVVWHTMALKRYGEIVQGPARGEYLTYALKEVK